MRGRPWAAAPEVMVTGAGRAGPSEPQSPRASGTTHEACGLWPQGGQGTWSPGQWASSSADGNPPPRQPEPRAGSCTEGRTPQRLHRPGQGAQDPWGLGLPRLSGPRPWILARPPTAAPSWAPVCFALGC